MTEGADAPEQSRWRRLLGGVLGAVVVTGIALAIGGNWSDFVASWGRIGMVDTLLSSFFAVLCVLATWRVWHAVFAGLGVTLDSATSARVFFVSQLGKYVPGSVWPIVLQAEAGRRNGAGRTTVLTGNLIALALSLTTGLALAAVLLPFSVPGSLGRFWWVLVALPLVALAAHPSTLPGLLDRLLVMLGRRPLGARLSGRATAAATVWCLVAWLCMGAHAAVLVAAMGTTGPSVIALTVGAMALAVCAGVLVVPAPAGAGPREAVLAYCLAGVLAGPATLVVVVASRVILVAVDLALAAFGAVVGRRR